MAIAYFFILLQLFRWEGFSGSGALACLRLALFARLRKPFLPDSQNASGVRREVDKFRISFSLFFLNRQFAQPSASCLIPSPSVNGYYTVFQAPKSQRIISDE